nr:uncharacterized protein LOC126053486 isoform X4 [Helicoverpa armigera]
MLKWAVYGKKNQDLRVSNDLDNEDEHYSDEHYNNNNKVRRSLDAQTVKKSKKPSRYQRRSLGSAAVRKNMKAVDKENVNYIGNTPNYYREGFIKKPEGIALKDVSNITPTGTPVKKFDRRKYYINSSRDDIPPDLPPTPPTYSRRVREAKKRKLEMASANEVFRRDSCVYKSERRIKPIDRNSFSPKLSHSTSEPSLSDLSDRLSATTTSSRNSFALGKQLNKPVCTTKTINDGLVEIEYDRDLVLNCVEKPLTINKSAIEKTTLPIFGHHIFMDNPLYFNNNDIGLTNIRPLKRTRKKSNDFESSFKSPSVDKKDAHTLVRDGCSPVSITPLSTKLAALRFSTMSVHSKSQRVAFNNDVTEYFPKVENPFTIPLRDEETSTEMENKFILGKDSTSNNTDSTVSTTQMGDVTLERMIEDIIKSTKIIKSKRRILNKAPVLDIHEEIPPLDTVKDLFVNPQAENKTNLIREAKYVNLSRENSVSPKTTPTKRMPVHRVNDKLLKNLPIGCFILDDGDGYNEREVRTPDNAIDVKRKASPKKRPTLNRSQSMNISYERGNLESMSSESTPDLYSAAEERASLRLKRQKCIRRKKSTVSNESQWKTKDLKTSILTLEIGIPSPSTELPNTSLCEPLSPPLSNPIETDDYQNISLKSNVSHSSLMPYTNSHNKRSRELFGLTLEHGIPSPITPVPNLKRPGKVLSEERAHKTSKLDDDFLPNDAYTPVIEHKSIRRCLTYSPEENSISSSEEKRRSVASNRLERSSERFQAPKGTIDLEIITRNDVIDVHVIRCRDLQRSSGKTDDINAYAKVVISGVTESQSLPSQRSIFQRTSVLYGKREPEFQRHLKLPLPTAVYDHQVLHISVWHRDKKYRRSEFLGCVSFPLKDAINCDISGTYFLQQGSGRGQNATQAHANDRFVREDRVTEGDPGKMATDNIETSTNDGTKENHDKGVSTNGPSSTTASQAQAVAAALQREADEHLFLRYLELDPPEDPNAPRRAPRNGRTPFTTTRKLIRGTAGGFGFTVVWTRPPRVERVAAGGSAERAGLRAGDYLVFVGNKNVVTSNEEEVRNLVKSAGQMLNIETFRRVPPNGVGIRPRLTQVTIPPAESTPPPPPRSPRGAALASPATAARPPTACSSTSQSLDRRKLHLPQVTFSKETPGLATDGRKRALLAVVAREQHYGTCLQFGLVRFVSPLAERADLIAPNDHQLLFQNIEEIFRLSEDILDQVVQDDGEIQTSTVVAIYLQKTPVFLSLYKKYCLGLKRADCVLVKKSKDPSGAFSRFCTSPPIPRRRPDITSLVHKPLEQFRELLRLMRAAAAANGAGPYDQLEKKQLQVIVEQLQSGYQDVTAGSGLMGLAGDGKPLLSVADLESRLVFTRCKPFVLSTAGRQWIFGGELSRVEGRAVRPYWALLFSDLLLFATVSRDRVLFVTEEPVALGTVSEAQFNVRKKATEFRLILGRAGGESPLVSCSPRTPGRTRTVVLRAPSIDLKAVWQSLLQRQIYRAHTMSGTPLGSPLDSPDPQLTFSLATLDSQQRQTRRSSVETQTGGGGSATEGARSTRSRGSTLHLQRWMTQLPEAEELDPPEPDMEMWSVEELRKRSKELNLLEVADLVSSHEAKGTSPGDKKDNDRSPSKSSNSGSQVQCVIAQEKYLNEVKCVESITLTKTKTATSSYPSPASVRKEQITRQKAENVLNKVLGMNIITKRENVGSCLKTSSVFLEDDSIHEDDNDFKIERGLRRSPRMGISAVSKMNGDINKKTEDVNANATDAGSDDDLELGPLMLMGLSAINPAAHLMRVEPFKRASGTSLNNPCSRPGSLGSVKSESPVPNIAVVPPTPDYNSTNKTDDLVDESPDSPDVPDDLPYVTLKRYGTMSSLERLPSDETDDGNVRLTAQEPETSKTYNNPVTGAAGGIMGWTARAGSFVVEKMNIFSYTESVPSTAIAHKQPSFLERCLGVSDWKSTIGTEEGTGETGEGSGASGEEAWGTPSSGDLSDNLPDSEHGTLSSPTKSSSSYAGDDDTELMMDELLMAPTITGPTTMRPLLPRDVFRRRLEPLMEEECSDSGSEDNKPTPTNSDDQGSERGLDADDCCDVPHPPPSASDQEPEGGDAGVGPAAGGEGGGGAGCELSPDRTPTNEAPSTPLLSVSREFAEVRAIVGAGRRGSASSDSTPSTLERTTIHNPTSLSQPGPAVSASEPAPAPEVTSPREEPRPPTPERLTPRAEMRLALDQGKDMLAEQEVSWGGGSDPWSFRAACQRSLLRRVASADAVTLCRAHPRRTAPHTTSRNSVYAWKVPESEKPMEMEQLARAEVQTMRSRTRSLCQNGKIMGFLRRRASSDSPRREPFVLSSARPFSPRRSSEKNFEKRFWKQVTRRRQSLGSISQI